MLFFQAVNLVEYSFKENRICLVGINNHQKDCFTMFAMTIFEI